VIDGDLIGRYAVMIAVGARWYDDACAATLPSIASPRCTYVRHVKANGPWGASAGG
jgi:hypothetical protein